jgi:hypothetical protein
MIVRQGGGAHRERLISKGIVPINENVFPVDAFRLREGVGGLIRGWRRSVERLQELLEISVRGLSGLGGLLLFGSF